MTARPEPIVTRDGLARYALECRSCKRRWMEDHAPDLAARDLARRHYCAGFTELRGDHASWQAILVMGVLVRRVTWQKDEKHHPCGPACWKAEGAVCRCDCGGKDHGWMLRAVTSDDPEKMEELYRRLER